LNSTKEISKRVTENAELVKDLPDSTFSTDHW